MLTRCTVLVAATLALASLGMGTGCADQAESRRQDAAQAALDADFGKLHVTGHVAMGTTASLEGSSRSAPMHALAFEGKAGTVVKVEVLSPEQENVEAEAVLVGTRHSGRPYVLAHGEGPVPGTLWFQLLRDGTHYVAAKEPTPSHTPIRVRVSEVLGASATAAR